MTGAAIVLPAAAMAQDPLEAQDVEQPEPVDQLPEQLSEAVPADQIVVTGFRASLNAAVAAKRNAGSQVDVIVAEDIAKFPDTNLAESLQRVPGITIQREAGEGRQVVVRGLGSQFTRVRVNGMEAIATSPDNNNRGFDFNIFASELFNSIVVHKTAEASLDEGSLGAVIDLNTGNPLSYDPGFSLVGSAQVRYNDLNEDAGPRLAGLIGWTNQDGTFGVSVSAAYSEYETPQLGNNTVRWQQATFRSVGGTPCFAGSAYVPSTVCNEVGLAFHPRIPRYGLISHERERLGLTGSVEWAPSDRTNISIDGLFANFKELREEFWGEVLFRSNERTIDVVDYTIDENNNLITGTFNNAWVRTENFRRELETKFYQVSANVEQQLTDTLAVNLLAGKSKSDAESPIESTLIFDDRDFNGYSYDYTDMYTPVLTFGGSGIDDPTQFQLAEFRDRPNTVVNEFETVSANAVWEATDEASIEVGGIYRKFTFDNEQFQRDSTYCAAFPADCAANPGRYGLPVTAAIAQTFNLGEAGQPAGTTESWVIPELDAAADAVGLYERTAVRNLGGDRSVTEETKGGYFQVNWDADLLGFMVTGNFGTRYVRTDQTSRGFQGSTEVTVERSYEDWLPAANLNIFLTEDLILRGAASKVMTRPGLGSLSPGGGIDQFNFGLSSGNPFLDPFRATAYDVALEWYFAPGSLVSVAAFAKDIVSFPISQTLTGTFDSFSQFGFSTAQLTPGTPVYNALVLGQNPNANFTFNTSVNGPGATLKGLEFNAQIPFDAFFDGFLANFGVLGNLTLIESDVDYTIPLPFTAISSGGNPTIPAGQPSTAVFTRPLFDLAKKAANGTIYYEDERFSARVSAAWRDSYIDGGSGNRNIFEGFGSTLNVDASVRYKLTDWVEVALEGTNLTDEYRKRWVNDPSKRNYENNHFGRVLMAGVRFQL